MTGEGMVQVVKAEITNTGALARFPIGTAACEGDPYHADAGPAGHPVHRKPMPATALRCGLGAPRWGWGKDQDRHRPVSTTADRFIPAVLPADAGASPFQVPTPWRGPRRTDANRSDP